MAADCDEGIWSRPMVTVVVCRMLRERNVGKEGTNSLGKQCNCLLRVLEAMLDVEVGEFGEIGRSTGNWLT